MKKEPAVYFVALKALFKKDGQVLFLKRTESGNFDLPGGRIDTDELETSLEEILSREIREELGEKIAYRIGRPLFTYRQQYFGKGGPDIFMIVHEVELLDGEIKLSDEHNEFVWVDPKTFVMDASKVFSKEEYAAYQKYLFQNKF